MKYSQSEKIEIIRMVEGSSLSVRQTLDKIGIHRSTFYSGYARYTEYGYDGLASRQKSPKQIWNTIPEWERDRVVEAAREYPERSCREIACLVTDWHGYFISESSVYRILKAQGLVSAPAYRIISAGEKFKHPTRRVHELWQTDFTYFKIINWGWYYLLSVLDDYSRYIIAWHLCTTMKAEDVKMVLEKALEETGVTNVNVYNRPRLLSDNGSCFISSELKSYLSYNDMLHIRSKAYHPMTQGKIERYHRSMKNLILLDNYYTPEQLTEQIGRWVEYYNNHRYHEALDNVTPLDRYNGRDREILEQRKRIKGKTMKLRRRINRSMAIQTLTAGMK
jgi:transposase InsO family protein/transposase-like protein